MSLAGIVNLRTRRKQKARDDARKTASARAAKSGETQAAKSLHEVEAAIAARRLDAHRREPHEE